MPETSRRSVLLPVARASLAGLTGPAPAAEVPIRLIVRGDDMGSSQASNEAAIRCYKDLVTGPGRAARQRGRGQREDRVAD